VIGITSAVHGNELAGIFCSQKLINAIDPVDLSGTLIFVLCVNPLGFSGFTRYFTPGITQKDLNRHFPGFSNRDSAAQFAWFLMEKIFSQFQYHIDLHTASFGDINSFYVRVNRNDPIAAIMADLIFPQIILHDPRNDGALRSALGAKGIPSICVELGPPQVCNLQYVNWAHEGIRRVLTHFNMYPPSEFSGIPSDLNPTLCVNSKWLFSPVGGLIEVLPEINSFIKKGQIIAIVKDIYGSVIYTHHSEWDGICISRLLNPVAMTGQRFIQVGFQKNQEMLSKL